MMRLKLLTLAFLIFSIDASAQKISDFTLKSVTDNSTFTLSKAKGKFVVLHFLLKTECPYCIKHTNTYFENASSLKDVIQVFIKPDNESEIKEWIKQLSSSDSPSLPIYRDPEASLAKTLNIPFGYKFHGEVVHYPALIIIDKKGSEVFRYIGKNNSDRFSFERLVEKLKEF